MPRLSVTGCWTLVAGLALLVGCSSGGSRAGRDGAVDADTSEVTAPADAAAPDARADASAPTDASPEVSPEASPDAEARADADAGGDVELGREAGRDADAGGDADAAGSSDAVRDADGSADVGPDADAGGLSDAGRDADAGGADAPGDVRNDSSESRETSVSPLCARAAQALTLSGSPLAGVLTGPSDNAFVSCGGLSATPGPEAVFKLQIDQPTTVVLRVDSSIDTVVAVRPGCSADISEVACADQPPSGAGSATVDGGSGKSTALTVRLAAGGYTVIVDTRAATAAPVAFTLTASAVPAPTNTDCAAASPLSLPAHVTSDTLDLTDTLAAPCATDAGRALYYTVMVPGGQRLTATVMPGVGDRPWTPRFEALAGCGSGTCLAQGHAVPGTTQELDWLNSSPDAQVVLLGLSADVPVRGAAFELDVSVSDQPSTCVHPTPVVDGTVLRGQNLRLAPPPPSPSCVDTQDHALYYSATLLPQQTLAVNMVDSATPNVPFSSQDFWSLRPSCGDASDTCFLGNAGSGTFTNLTSAPMTVFIEATLNDPMSAGLFDLQVSMPPPPAGITVTPQSGLVTTEAGGTATFQVALGTSPKAGVTIGVASDTPSEGVASPASLQFDATNWNVPQVVTVTGVDDQVVDGARAYVIVTGAAVSTDARYSGLNAADVFVTNLDDEPGLLIEGAEALATSEAGASATFTARLARAPTATVRTALTSSDISEGTVSPAELVFSPSDWNVPQTVTVTGVDDALADGTQAYAIVTAPWVGADPSYAGQDPADVTVHNRDDDANAVGTKLLNPDVDCDGLDAMAVDGFGTVYILLRCGGTLAVVTSVDGGATFSERVALPTALQAAGWGQISAGEGGTAFVACDTTDGLALTRTSDGGATWSAPQILLPMGDNGFQLTSAGNLVQVLFYGGASNDQILWRSSDAGRTFFPQTRMTDGVLQDVAMPDGTNVVWFVTGDDKAEFHESTDGAATFASVGIASAPQHGRVNLGVHSAFDVDDDATLDVIDLRHATVTRTVANLPYGTTVVDEADNLTIVYDDGSASHLTAWRLASGASAPLPNKILGPGGQIGPEIGAAALSRNAVAMTFASGGLVLFGTTTWP